MKKIIISIAMLTFLGLSGNVKAQVVASGNCGASGNNLTYQITGAYPFYTLTISGSGLMKDYVTYGVNIPPWNSYKNNIITIIIGDSVTSIGDEAFYQCYNLTSVKIGMSIASIGNYAFWFCNSLQTVNYWAINCTTINDHSYRAFAGCNSFTTLNILQSVKSIPENAFLGCSSLTSVNFMSAGVIKNSLTTIGDYAFYACNGLTSITIPDSVTSIGDYAFGNCSGLTSIDVSPNNTAYSSDNSHAGILFNKSKTTLIQYPNGKINNQYSIPNSVTTIGNGAFSENTHLIFVTIPNSVTSIGDYTFYSCRRLKSITIPDSVITIGDDAFARCDSLTSVIIGNNVINIGHSAFYKCSSLKSVVIPNSVISIGEYAFSYCDSLTSVTIGKNATNMGRNVFYPPYPNNLKHLYMLNENPPFIFPLCSIGDVFLGIDKSVCILHVPACSRSKYATAYYWEDFHNIQAIGLCPLNITTDSLQSGAVDIAYSVTLTAIGDDTKIWSLKNGNLPNGLNLDTNGTISGVPTIAGIFNFTVKVENVTEEDTAKLSIIIDKGVGAMVDAPTLNTKTATSITINAVMLPNNGQMVEYAINTSNFVPTNGWQTNLNFTNLSINTTYYIFARSAENNNYYVGEASMPLSVSTILSISSDNLPNGTTNTPYSVTLTAIGNTPISWELENGNLPDGLNLYGNGIISGTPTKTGTFNFTVKASNIAGSATKGLSIIINAGNGNMPNIITTILPGGTENVAYSTNLIATGNTPITWTLESGNLPNGLNFYGNGIISGMPTKAGIFNFTVKASNSFGSDKKNFAISIVSDVGIVETDNYPSLRIFPNPANDKLFIECKDFMPITIKLHDILGRELLTQTVNGKTEVNVSHLPNGMYNVNVFSEGKIVGNSKIVKQ